ncbi:MAG: hypothetical protein ACJAVV_001476 [Alphaproteobacteria bacterium]|jgi:hypothetical protein
MKRQYYISSDLKDLQLVEEELKSQGITTPQIHVLSENDAEVEKHHLHAIEAVLKQDVVRSMKIGAVVGIVAALLVLLVSYLMQWHISAAGWVPFAFLAVVLLGFCTWVGGFIGIQVPNYEFRQFQKLLKKGKHIFFVDITDEQRAGLEEVINLHPNLSHAGTGEATPEWVVKGQETFTKFMKSMP